MRCLYCGKQLALLKRLTGGGEFCSDAHKQSYQEEYNRLALSRLLQAQSKPGEIKTKAASKAPAEGLGVPLPPGASRHAALPASFPTPEVVPAEPLPEPLAPAARVEEEAVYQAAETFETPVAEKPPVEAVEESPVLEAVEEIPPEATVFSMELPSIAWLEDALPYIEPYLETATALEIPGWIAASESYSPSLASLAALSVGSPMGQMDFPMIAGDPNPREFARSNVDLSGLLTLSFASAGPSQAAPGFESLPTAELIHFAIGSAAGGEPPKGPQMAASPVEFAAGSLNRNIAAEFSAPPSRLFPAASPVPFDVRIAVSRATHPASLNGVLQLPVGVTFAESPLLTLCPAEIDFPAEDAEVVLVAGWADSMFSELAPESQDGTAVSVMEPAASPRQALDALSKLHRDLAEEQQARQVPAEPAWANVEVVESPAEPAAAQIEPAGPVVDVAAKAVDEGPIPRPAVDLFPIPTKTFAPPKPAIAVDSQALVNLVPDVPAMKSLPLRPKVAKAPAGFSPQPDAAPTQAPAGEQKAKSSMQPPPVRGEVRTKPIPSPPSKQAQPVKPTPAAPQTNPGQPVKPTPSTKPTPPVKPAQTAKTPPQEQAKPVAPRTPADPQEPASAKATSGTESKPAARAAEGKKPEPAAKKTEQAEPAPPSSAPAPSDDPMPSFAGIEHPKKVPFLASVKFKLVLAIVLVLIAAGAYMLWSGKSHRSNLPSSAVVPDDVVGPSIMMGEGGWVPGWGADVNGSRAGREITIYRPSLKLSDYRIEFQGSIEVKSIGWVFRALDPYNYYAAKLSVVSPGKLALIKFSVEQGHEKEVGRTPLTIDANSDTLFSIRMDVRGSTFRTYVQGQSVDVWTDDRLKAGGVGFFNERAERARIKSSSIYYLSGGKN